MSDLLKEMATIGLHEEAAAMITKLANRLEEQMEEIAALHSRIETLEAALRLAWSLTDPEMVTASHKRIIRAALAPEQDK